MAARRAMMRRAGVGRGIRERRDFSSGVEEGSKGSVSVGGVDGRGSGVTWGRDCCGGEAMVVMMGKGSIFSSFLLGREMRKQVMSRVSKSSPLHLLPLLEIGCYLMSYPGLGWAGQDAVADRYARNFAFAFGFDCKSHLEKSSTRELPLKRKKQKEKKKKGSRGKALISEGFATPQNGEDSNLTALFPISLYCTVL